MIYLYHTKKSGHLFVVEEHLYGSQTFHRSEYGLDSGSIIQALKG